MPAITLTTDFGLQDGHVGAMKGAIHGIAPQAVLIDVSHSIPPQNVRHGAFVLMTSYPHWPPDTVHLIVVDPGVGTQRRALAVETPSGFFVAPDNGVLSYVLAREDVVGAVELSNPRYWRHPVSAVFHGRDIFGPAAAHLANGVPLAALGPSLEPGQWVTWPIPTPRSTRPGQYTAHIQHIDHFGNCTTDITPEHLAGSSSWQIQVGSLRIERIHATFGDVAAQRPVAFVDSTGFLAIAVRDGSAARVLGLEVGDSVELIRFAPAAT